MKPENPEEGSNMFTFKKEKEEAMSEEEKKMAQEMGDAIGNLEEAGLFYEEIEWEWTGAEPCRQMLL